MPDEGAESREERGARATDFLVEPLFGGLRGASEIDERPPSRKGCLGAALVLAAALAAVFGSVDGVPKGFKQAPTSGTHSKRSSVLHPE